MKLTRRQAGFFRNFLELYREMQDPIHYSVLAERVGVSRITAYDMLRVLEEKGYVASDYRRAMGKTGPGRAEIVYWPTERAQQLIAEFSHLDGWAGEQLTDKVLEYSEGLEQFDPPAFEIASEMLARIPPDGPRTVQYCVEVMTVIALRLRHEAGRSLLLEHMSLILTDSPSPTTTDLNLLCGIATGILLNEDERDQDWVYELLVHSRQYFSLVVTMPAKNRRLLAGHLRETVRLLRQISSQTGVLNAT